MDVAQQVGSSSRARPLRYVYLIEDTAEAGENLTRSFSHSYARWAGRYTLFVYMQSSVISPLFFHWMQRFDPDVVVSYTRLPDKTIENIQRKIAPLWFWQPMQRSNGELYRPRVDAGPLSSLSVLPQLVGQGVPWGEPPRFILDSFPQWLDDGLIRDNFGVLRDADIGFPPQASIEGYLEPLILIPPDAPANRYHMRKTGSDITSDVELLGRMSPHGNGIVTMSELASRGAPQEGFQHDAWVGSFNLIVGDSLIDRICAWNSWLLSDGWRRQGFSSFRVPVPRFASADFISQLVAFLNARNFIGQSNGPARLTIRSHSLTVEQLTAIQEQLRSGLHSSLSVQRIGGADECCPTMTSKVPYVPDPAAEALVQVPKGQLHLPAPAHLVDSEDIPKYMRNGNWMVDASIDRHVNLSKYANDPHSWHLPKRKALARLFFQHSDVRINRHGSFSLVASTDRRHADVSLPSDEDVFRTVLHGHDSFARDDARYKGDTWEVPFRESRRGDKGQYLIGVVELFGGLDSAIRFISSHFWRSRFLEMAAPNKDVTVGERIVELMKAKLRSNGGALVIDSEQAWARLADVTRTVAQGLRKPEETTTVADLVKFWGKELDAVRAAQPDVIRPDETNEYFADQLKMSLRHLRDLGVFVQGFQWRCRSCGHKNWAGMQQLAETLACEICSNEKSVPVQFEWDFHLNEFFATSLRDHDTLSLVWALGQLRDRAKICFAFAPPTELMRQDRDDMKFVSDAEIDLMCIIDGQLVLLEAKDAPRQLSTQSQQKIQAVARAYRPDTVVIACMSGADKIKAKVAQLEAALSPDGIKVELLALDEKSWNEPDFFLPH